MYEHDIRQLAAAVMLQAVKDYVEATKGGKIMILHDLRSGWMQTLSNGQSLIIAEQLEKHPDEIKRRIKNVDLSSIRACSQEQV